MRKVIALIPVIMMLSSCHRDFAERNPLGYIPILVLFGCIVIMTGYALRLTFRKKK